MIIRSPEKVQENDVIQFFALRLDECQNYFKAEITTQIFEYKTNIDLMDKAILPNLTPKWICLMINSVTEFNLNR